MDIFSVITLFGGLAFFLYGMHLLSSSLEKMVGGKLERILRSMTSNRFKALLLGMGITIAIQSSSAMTVMLVGLVNSGIMELGQTIGVIMGSNIGTTVTAWILSLSGITSDNVFVQLLKPESFFAHRGAHRHHSHHVHQEQQEKGHRLRMCRLRHFDDRHDHDEWRGKTACGLAAV